MKYLQQISNEGVEIIDKTKMTNRVTSEMADELINSIETINEVITSSEQLREEVAFFKFQIASGSKAYKGKQSKKNIEFRECIIYRRHIIKQDIWD